MQSAIISGYPCIGIHDDHMGMTKFDNKDDPGFISVVGVIRRWVRQIEMLDINHGFSNSTNVVNQANTGTEHLTSIPPDNSHHTSLDSVPPFNAEIRSSFEHTESVPTSRSLFIPSEINHGIVHILQRPLLFKIPSAKCLLYYGHVKGHSELVKFGITTWNLKTIASSTRQEQLQLHLPSVRSYEGDRHHIRRIEHLVHMELSNERTTYGNNREIFNVELGKVQHITKRWLNLFDPETKPTLYGPDGQLRKSWYDRIQRIADPAETSLEYNLDSQIAR